MVKNQVEYMRYWNLFKSNYAKGIRALENILENPLQAKELVSNINAVSVLLSTPIGRDDRTSAILRDRLAQKTEYQDIAVEVLIKNGFKYENIDDVFNSEEKRDELLNSHSIIWRSVQSSDKPLARFVLFAIGKESENLEGFSAIVNNVEVMNSILNNKNVWDIVRSSKVAIRAIANSVTGLEAIMKNNSALRQMHGTGIFWQTIVNNAITCNAILKSVENIKKILDSSAVWHQLTHSDIGRKELENLDSECWQEIAKSPNPIPMLFTNSNTFRMVLEHDTIWSIIKDSENTWAGVRAGDNFDILMRNNKRWGEIVQSENHMKKIVEDSMFMQRLARDGNALKKISESAVACDVINSSSNNNKRFKDAVRGTLQQHQEVWRMSANGGRLNRQNVQTIGTGIYFFDKDSGAPDILYINRTEYRTAPQDKMTESRHSVHFGSGFIAIEGTNVQGLFLLVRRY